MAFDRFLIAPIETGLQKNVKPFLIADDAFEELTNCYMFRGRVQKRFGGELINTTTPYNNRLRYRLAATDGAGNFNFDLAVLFTTINYKVGQTFTVGTTIFTILSIAAGPQPMLSTGTATGTFDVTTNIVNIIGATPATSVYFYLHEPVMGLLTQENSLGSNAINNEDTIAFDTKFAYKYDQATQGWIDYGTGLNGWNGTNADFFWGTNYQGALNNIDIFFTSNNVDPIRWISEQVTSVAADTWTNFTPLISASTTTATTIETARLIVPYQDRLLLFNTKEGGIGYPQRCRYSQVGNAMYDFPSSSPGSTDGAGNFVGVIAGTDFPLGATIVIGPSRFLLTAKGTPANLTLLPGGIGTATLNTTTGALTVNASTPNRLITYYPNYSIWSPRFNPSSNFIDVPTREEIVSAQYLQNRLIVFCERSTWELVSTGNAIAPFVFKKINTELGVESPFSVIPFDRITLGIGDVGVHACSGNNVERIDTKIPDDVFQILNTNAGPLRVYGIRDYYTEFAYWTFPSFSSALTFPYTKVYQDRVLLFNYRNGSWAYNDDSITCFGYYFKQQASPTWNDLPNITWQEATFSWAPAPQQVQFRNIIAGNQTGFVWVVSSGEDGKSYNAPVLPITNIISPGVDQFTITVVDHNLNSNEYVQIENCIGNDPLNAFYETYINKKIVQVIAVDKDTLAITTPFTAPFVTYLGGGTLRRVSEINILTKQYNFYLDKSRNAAVSKIDFMIDSSDTEITIDTFPGASLVPVDSQSLTCQPYPSLNYPYQIANITELNSPRFWHPIYTSIEGEFIQLRIYQSDEQLRDATKSLSNFVLHGMLFYAQPTSFYLQ